MMPHRFCPSTSPGAALSASPRRHAAVARFAGQSPGSESNALTVLVREDILAEFVRATASIFKQRGNRLYDKS